MAIKTLTERRQMRFATIEKYLASKLTQKKFCEQEQLTYSTFQLWLKKYRQAKPPAISELSNNFVPLTFQTPAATANYIIEYPNGVVLHINRAVEPQTLRQLIHASGA
ncbi:MAG: hypothetical protein AB1706_19925 [Pseudomonadota bacterium]